MRTRWSPLLLALLACGDANFAGVDDAGATDGSSADGTVTTSDAGSLDGATETSTSCGAIPCSTTLLANTRMYEPIELAVNSARVFWTETNGTTSLLESCPIAGCSSAADFIQHQTALDTFGGIGADDDGVAFTLTAGNLVVACSSTAADCTPVRLSATTSASPVGVAFTDTLHVAEGSSGGIDIHYGGGISGYPEGSVSLVVVAPPADLFFILEPTASNYVVQHAMVVAGLTPMAPANWAEVGIVAPLGLAASPGLAVWVDGSNLVHFAGTAPPTSNVTLAPDAALQRVATDGTKIYATDDTGRVLRCDLPTCSNVTAIVTGATHPRGIAVDANYIYFADRGGASGRILRVAK